tara:strand:+ start:312 stop:1097 length:786 start_codon:yes stop_codon:yes gene_type:complete
MLYNRQGFPEEGELVMCTVTKVNPHSVFVELDEFKKGGMVSISEVSPGRIRNIRDYVVEGKKIVCKVLKINKEKGYIDLSYRRVNENQKRTKVEQIKQEQKAEKIVEQVSKDLKKDLKVLYKQISENVFQKYSFLSECFYEVVDSDLDLAKLGVEKTIAKKLTELIKQRIKPVKVEIKGVINLSTYESDGVEVVKKVLAGALKGREGVEIKYNGAGKYSLAVIADDFPNAEKEIDSVTSYIEKHIKNCIFEFVRGESKKVS